MRIFGKNIEDICKDCGNVIDCELFKAGHGIDQERNRVSEMLRCQMSYQEKIENGEKICP